MGWVGSGRVGSAGWVRSAARSRSNLRVASFGVQSNLCHLLIFPSKVTAFLAFFVLSVYCRLELDGLV